MAKFDFISGEDFKASLEADYRELVAAIDVKAWKAAHVLAGSVIEAILVDHLVATDYQKRKSRDPLTMTFADLIAAGKSEGILSERTENLSTVLRGYRNLIHPGRVIRTKETVDENGATVARALTELIIAEVASTKMRTFGYTAEQILSKLEQDSSALAIFDHLLKDMHQSELERLLGMLPDRYIQYILSDEEASHTLGLLPQYFRPAFDRGTDEVRARISQRFVTILKEQSGGYIRIYEESFFRPTDMSHLNADGRALVLEHLLPTLKEEKFTSVRDFLKRVEGIGTYLPSSDVSDFVDIIVRLMIHTLKESKNETDTFEMLNAIEVEYDHLPEELRSKFEARLDTWSGWLDSKEQADAAQLVRQLKAWITIDESDVPF